MKIFPQLFVLLVLAVIPAAGSAFFHPKKPLWNPVVTATADPGEVPVQTALGWGDRVLWLDARTKAEYDPAHIPGAMLLNEDDWDGLLPPVLAAWNKDRYLVVYCGQSCNASKEVAGRLRNDARLPNIYVLKGGWEAWLALKK